MEIDGPRIISTNDFTARNRDYYRLTSVRSSAELQALFRHELRNDAKLVSKQDLSGLDEESVQRIMQLLQSELDQKGHELVGITPAEYHKNCLRYLRWLSKTYQVLPRSLILSSVKRQGTNPVAGGGYADIWRGTVVGTPVCLKVLRLHMEPNQETRNRLRKEFCHEALVWRQLKHPNILPLLGVNAELFSPSFCLISPWMDNGDIISYLRNNPDHDLYITVSDIAAGLHYLHSRDPPITHGDIRGANILVTPDARCCLADFGLTLITSESGAWSSAATSTGTMKGAIRWMAPELLFGSTSSTTPNLPSRDLYAFGCTVVEILTLKPPFHHLTTEPSVVVALMKGERPPRPNHIWCTNTVWEFIDRCWPENTEERPKSNEIVDFFLSLMYHDAALELYTFATPTSSSCYDRMHEALVGNYGSTENKRITEHSDAEVLRSATVGPVAPFKWVRGKFISRGMSGSTYRALNTTTGKWFAVKQVESLETATDTNKQSHAAAIQILKLESETLKNLIHPHIVQYLGFEETPSTFSLFMEEVTGGSIWSALSQYGTFAEDVTKSFTSQILSSLEYLHSVGIIHRNLNAINTLVDATGTCKLTGFSLAKRADDSFSSDIHWAAVTAMQVTVFWMAPEAVKPHAQDKMYTPKMDIWSIGAMVLEMWATTRPLHREKMVPILFESWFHKLAPTVPEGLTLSALQDDFRQKCFAINPEERPSAAELKNHDYLVLRPGWVFTGFT